MAKQKNIPDAMPADAGTANALAASGVKPGDLVETDAGETLRVAETDPVKVAIRKIAAHYGSEFEAEIAAILA